MSLWETAEVIKKDKLNQKNVLVGASAPDAANTFQGQLWYDTSIKRIKVAYETAVTGENVGTGDGSTTTFYLDNTPVKPLSETVYVDGQAQTRDTDYTIDYDTGAITFTTAPASGATITVDYTYFSWKLVRAENLTEIPTRSHADLQNIGANDHHTAFTATDHDARDHSAVAGTIKLSELGTKAHGELTGIGTDDHHPKFHAANHVKGGADPLTGTIKPAKLELDAGSRKIELVGGNGSFVLSCQDGSGRLHIYWNAYYDNATGVHRFIKAGDYAGWLLIGNDGKLYYRRSTEAAPSDGASITWTRWTSLEGEKIVIGQDVNLYRSAADELATDDAFLIKGKLYLRGPYTEHKRDNATDYVYASIVSGDSVHRFATRTDGKLEWGPGNASRDVNLYRAGVDILKTDDHLHVGKYLTLLGADLNIKYSPRGTGGRALVHDSNNKLTINYAGDFSGGINLGSKIVSNITVEKTSPVLKLVETATDTWYPRITLENPNRSWLIYQNPEGELQFYDKTGGYYRYLLGLGTTAPHIWYSKTGYMRMYLTDAGDLYIDGTYNTFSPEIPKSVKKLKRLIKAILEKPHPDKDSKGRSLCPVCKSLVQDCPSQHREEFEKKYGKDIGLTTLATAKLTLTLLDYIEKLERKIQALIEKLESE
jgi:hypothetical protein